MTRPEAIPVSVIGGYLGAGKTTLVNHLLRHADGLRFAVLVNEFGDLSIDADLIEADDGDMIAIAGGCICCSYGSDLMAALMELPQRLPNMDAVLIEASGVALPGGIVSALSLLPEYALDAVLVVADAETILERAQDRYLADTITRQLADADIIIVNKDDLIAPARRDAITAFLNTSAKHARVLSTQHAHAPLSALTGLRLARPAQQRDSSAHFESNGFITITLIPSVALQAEHVAQQLARAEAGLMRAKGFVRTAAGELMTIQVVGQRYSVTPAPAGVRPGIVCIGARADVNHDLIRNSVIPNI